MIANISPSSLTFEDTYNTLKYASRAKKIRTTLKQNVITTNMPKEFLLKKCNDQDSEIEKLKLELEKYKEKVRLLEQQIIEQKTVAAATSTSAPKENVDLTKWYLKIDTAYEEYKKAREVCYLLQSNAKFLHLRIKLKENYEHAMKLLTLDSANLQSVSVLFSIIFM
jgi:kinesin family protein 18/19